MTGNGYPNIFVNDAHHNVMQSCIPFVWIPIYKVKMTMLTEFTNLPRKVSFKF